MPTTMIKISVYFTTCSPAPTGGYKIYYRVAGTEDAYTSGGTFFTTPAVFYDRINPAGTCYEGYIVTDCGNDVMGNHIPFETCGSATLDNSSCATSIIQTTAALTYVDLGLFDLHVDGSVTVILHYQTYDRPNRFTLYEDGVNIDTSGWKGYAPYAGPWGVSLSTAASGDITFNPVLGRAYQVRIEAGPAGPPPYNISDNFVLDIHCND